MESVPSLITPYADIHKEQQMYMKKDKVFPMLKNRDIKAYGGVAYSSRYS
jgi:hypothetical protein